MAEKYGVVPPKFSKEWWPYFWEYYKIHTIAITAVAVAVISTAVQCATKEKFDINITYGGGHAFTTEMSDAVEAVCSPLSDDVDGDGNSNVFFQAMTISGEQGFEQMDMALQTKLELQFQTENSFIYLFDKNQLDAKLSLDYVDELFVPVSEWAGGIDEASLVKAPNGTAYGIDISNSKLLKDCGVLTEGMYAALKMNFKEEEALGYESSVKVLREIIK